MRLLYLAMEEAWYSSRVPLRDSACRHEYAAVLVQGTVGMERRISRINHISMYLQHAQAARHLHVRFHLHHTVHEAGQDIAMHL